MIKNIKLVISLLWCSVVKQSNKNSCTIHDWKSAMHIIHSLSHVKTYIQGVPEKYRKFSTVYLIIGMFKSKG